MNRIMLNATNTMGQLQKQLDTISHNMANVDTVGYKNRRATFQELLTQQFNNQPLHQYEGGRQTPIGIRQGTGAKLGQTQLQLTQGPIKPTERMLDFAFTAEDQFLTVQVLENGQQQTRFTRNGSLYLSPINNNEVMLVNSEGHPVLNSNGQRIVFPDNIQEIQLQHGGMLTAMTGNGNSVAAELGITQIIRPQLLQGVGGSLFAMNNGDTPEAEVLNFLLGAARGNISLQQGMLEQSNVDMAKEMTDLTITQRTYQFNARSIQMADQMMGLVNGLKQ